MLNKILITGCSGFIGFHMSRTLLKDGIEVFGVDNMNDYYCPILKEDRLKILKKFPNFKFKKKDICDYESLFKIFNNFKPHKIIHLAAQAGVQHSITDPFSYVKSNLEGFVNILELSKRSKIDHVIYASSSSVYGNNDKIPFCTTDRADYPLSLYAATKRSNELLAYSYSNLYDISMTGLRFFTAYGPWGRPDMAYFIFTEKIFSKIPIQVYNNGKLKRDFTYIDDIIAGIKSSMKVKKKYEIYNLGNNKSENIMNFISCIENSLGMKAMIEYLPLKDGDVKQTYANIDKSIKELNYKPSVNINDGIDKFINWYKEYKNNN